MLKVKTVIKVVLVVILISSIIVLFRSCWQKTENNNDGSSSLIENADIGISKEELLKKEYEQTLEKKKKFEASINSETKIILLTIKESTTIAHDKTPENNKFTEWLINSNLCLEIRYTAIFSIPTNVTHVEIDTKDDTIVSYERSKIKVEAINIDSIISTKNKSVFGSNYSPEEVNALTLLATDAIRENLEQDVMLKFMAEQNLISYLRNQAYKHYIFNVKIVGK